MRYWLWLRSIFAIPRDRRASVRARRLTRAGITACVAAGILTSVAPSMGQPTAPSTAPATQPATAPASQPATTTVYTLSTPKDALKFFAAALRDGDAERLHKAVLTSDEAEQRMVTAIADMARALASLHQSAAKAYGVDAARRFTDDTAAGFDHTAARIDAAEVVVNGETAIVRYADAKENPYELKRVNGDWRLLASQFTQGAKPSILDRHVMELGVQTRIVLEIGKEIADGKHKSAEAAGLAWRSKMMAALAGEGATTRPASQLKK